MPLTNCFIPTVISGNNDERDTNIRNSMHDPCANISSGVVYSEGVIGSSYIELSSSKIICSIIGPKLGGVSSASNGQNNSNLEIGALDCEIHFANFLVNYSDESFRQAQEKLFSRSTKNALESAIHLNKYPKSTFLLYAIILETSNFDLAALINAGSMALADASIEMDDLVTSTVISNRTTISDHYKNHELTISLMLNLDLVAHIDYKGSLGQNDLFSCIKLGKTSCETIKEKMKKALLEKLIKSNSL